MIQFKINNIDIANMGATFLDTDAIKIYDELTKPSVPKDTLINDWPDQNGKERDVSARVYKSRQLTLPVMIEGASRSDYLNKKIAFNNLLNSGYFNLKCYDINLQYDLIFIDVSSYKYYTTYCTFNLIVEDDYPHLNTPIT